MFYTLKNLITEVISLDEKRKARLKAMGIEVRSGTPEEAESLGISIFTVQKSGQSKDSLSNSPKAGTINNLPQEMTEEEEQQFVQTLKEHQEQGQYKDEYLVKKPVLSKE